MNFTVTDIMNKRPCPEYTEEVVLELWAGREELAFKEVCTLDISADDRIWIAVRLAARDTVVSWADYCAAEAQKHASASASASASAADYAADYAADAATNAAYAAYYAADAAAAASAAASAAYWAADAAATAADADWTKTRNEELERFLSKLVEMNKSQLDPLTSAPT